MMNLISRHAKSLLAGVIAIGTTVQSAISDDVITSAEKVAIMIAFMTAVIVYAAPNQEVKPPPGG